MTIQQYLDKINTLYKTGNAREHSYRGDLQNLIMAILPDVLVTNEPARVDCGAPDYVLTRKDVPIGYIEAKDIGVDLGSKTLKEQFDRYKSGLTNLIFTDYMDFHFYKEGEFVTKIAIAKIENGAIVPITENFVQFTELIKNFALTVSQTIKSPTKLAQMMAGKAKLMADVIEKSLNYDDQAENRSPLKNQMLSFQSMLIHDIDNKAFSDIYAQTIAYGMFAARYHDPSLPTFSRMEAAELIPKSNPFLRKLFQDIAGFDLDNRLVWIVDELVNIFLASDVAQIMKNFGKSTKQEDPVVHFYETFLGEYNPALRKARGVWYTPQPVVNFIVRAVDDILKTEFDLPQGLADTSKTKVKVDYYGKKIEKEVHKVQILDPATGTGTFLAEVVKHIHKRFEGQQGIWSKYVTNDLIPRLNGFELLMASYAMAHLKMDMLLTETGYKPTDDQRFKIFLTNSLEEAHQDSGTLFSSWLSDESNQANEIKRDTPVMCVIGNPPYNRDSFNNNDFIKNLTKDYRENLQERNSVTLENDYVKFLRLGQLYVDKNNEGVLAFICPNSYLSGATFSQMRNSLAKSFDKIYIIDLHGDATKQEFDEFGKSDKNVFDIKTGVSINIFIKKNKAKTTILTKDILGNREYKYDFLMNETIHTINWNSFLFEENKPWRQRNEKNEQTYEKYFSVKDIFFDSTPCIRTHNDKELVSFSKFQTISSQKYLFKAFDLRFVDYDLKKIGRSRISTMYNFLELENLGLIFQRGSSNAEINTPFITNILSDQGAIRPGTTSTSNVAPLYLYTNNNGQTTLEEQSKRVPNLNMEIVNQIATGLELTFTNEKEETPNTFAPIDLLDYIYAVLHSPTYREKYKEFLKIDFPRVPAPLDHETFWKLVKLGGELRQIHLLESPIVEKYITGYPEDGDNVVKKPSCKEGNVYINDTQYFSNVPEVAWNFYIGGYQPAQKWLKDRKDRELSYDDILHYQKIIVALSETDRIMKEIDLIEIL